MSWGVVIVMGGLLAVVGVAVYVVLRWGLPWDDESIGGLTAEERTSVENAVLVKSRQLARYPTAEEFERQYAARSGMTVDRLRELGRVVRPCSCGEEGCEGWRSVSRERAAEIDWDDAWRDYAPREPWL